MAMKLLPLLPVILLLSINSLSQVKDFELTNPDALQLTDSRIELLTSTPWKSYLLVTYIRGNHTENSLKAVLKYTKEGFFEYMGGNGVWTVLEDRFIKHIMIDDNKRHIDYKFGGKYAITEISDSTLTLTKMLTSSYDMQRIIYFRKHNKNTPTITHFSFSPDHLQGVLSPQKIDSISRLSMEVLFAYDYKVVRDTIYVQTADSLFRIKRKVD